MPDYPQHPWRFCIWLHHPLSTNLVTEATLSRQQSKHNEARVDVIHLSHNNKQRSTPLPLQNNRASITRPVSHSYITSSHNQTNLCEPTRETLLFNLHHHRDHTDSAQEL